ncbi:hypothetical protein D1872_240060 [compost metagenome]
MQVTDYPLQARKNSIAVLEGELAKVDFKHGFSFMYAILPIGLSHVDLIFIRMQCQTVVSIKRLRGLNILLSIFHMKYPP